MRRGRSPREPAARSRLPNTTRHAGRAYSSDAARTRACRPCRDPRKRTSAAPPRTRGKSRWRRVRRRRCAARASRPGFQRRQSSICRWCGQWGPGNGQSSSPIARIARFGFMGEISSRCFARARRANSVLFGAVLRGIARGENSFRPWTENGRQPRGVVVVRRIDDGLRRSLGRIEALLRDGRRGACNRQRRANDTESASHCAIASLHRRAPRHRRHRRAPAAESAERAPRSHAGEAVVALHARHPAVVITAEDTVIARPAALLKTRISEALLRRRPPRD